MLLKNENASIRLDFVSYEFPETEYGMDEYDKNWLPGARTAMTATLFRRISACLPGRRESCSGCISPFICPTQWMGTIRRS